jgi:tetratricopeptide (TPR) repeat protein
MAVCPNCGQSINSSSNSSSQTGLNGQLDSNLGTVKSIMINKIKTRFKIVAIMIVVGIIIFVFFNKPILQFLNDMAEDTADQAVQLYNSGDTTGALNNMLDALEMASDPKIELTLLKNIAYIYIEQGSKEDALEYLNKALLLASKDSFDYYLITGEIAWVNGQTDSAYTAYEQAKKLKTDDYQLNNNLALLHLNLNGKANKYFDYTKALAYSKKAVELNKTKYSQNILGIAYYFNKDYKNAISILGSLSGYYDPISDYYLGLAYLDSGDDFNSIVYLKSAIQDGVTPSQKVVDFLKKSGI